MATERSTAFCSRCGEALEWRPEYQPPKDPDLMPWFKTRWFHVETGEQECDPACTFEVEPGVKCGKRPSVCAVGYHGFDGACARFIRTGHRCADHKQKGGMIEWT